MGEFSGRRGREDAEKQTQAAKSEGREKDSFYASAAGFERERAKETLG